MMRSTAQLAGKEVVLALSVRHSNLQCDVEGKRETDTVWDVFTGVPVSNH